jgi:hypothetical protein
MFTFIKVLRLLLNIEIKELSNSIIYIFIAIIISPV